MRRVTRIALRAALAVTLLALVFRFIPLTGVAAALGNTEPGYLLLGIGLQFVMRVVATVRMRVITADQGMSLGHVALFRILLATQFYSQLLPGSIVGGGATWLKCVQSGASTDAALAAVILHRGISTMVAIGVGSAAWLLRRGEMTPPAIAVSLAILIALCALAVVRVPVRMESVSIRTGRVRRWLHRVLRRLLRFHHIPVRGKLVVIFDSFVYETVAAMAFWSFAAALSIELHPLDAVWIRVALQLVLMAPVTIAGLGVREASLVGLGSLVGVGASDGVAWSLLVLAGTQVVAIAGGLIEAHATAGIASRRLVTRRAPDAGPDLASGREGGHTR